MVAFTCSIHDSRLKRVEIPLAWMCARFAGLPDPCCCGCGVWQPGGGPGAAPGGGGLDGPKGGYRHGLEPRCYMELLLVCCKLLEFGCNPEGSTCKGLGTAGRMREREAIIGAKGAMVIGLLPWDAHSCGCRVGQPFLKQSTSCIAPHWPGLRMSHQPCTASTRQVLNPHSSSPCRTCCWCSCLLGWRSGS